MKKKLVLTGMILGMCVGLCACGNPLKQLPEVSDENLCDVEDEKLADVCDEILDYLEDEGAYTGDVTSLVVYDRDDNEDTKEKSEVYVELSTETDKVEYVYYYIVTMKFDKEKGWRAKSYEEDEDNPKECHPLESVTEDTVVDCLIYYVYSYSSDDFYCYISNDTIDSLDIASNEITEDEDGNPIDVVSGNIVFDGGYCTASGTFEMTFEFDDYYGEWDYEDCTFSDSFEIEYSEVVEEQLSEDIMLADLKTLEYTPYYYEMPLSLDPANYADPEFSEYTFSGSYAYRTITLPVENTETFSGGVDVELQYYDNGDGYEFDYFYADIMVTADNLVGDYSAAYYTTDGSEKAGEVYYSFTSVDLNNGECSGTVVYVPEGKTIDSVDPVTFEGSIYDDSIGISFDEKVYYGKGSYDYMYYSTLYFDVSTGLLTGEDSSYVFALERAQ